MVPLFGAVPGGPELLVVLLVVVLLFGVPIALLLVLGVGGVRLLGDASDDGADDARDERLAALERELEATREELRTLREEDAGGETNVEDGDAADGDAGRPDSGNDYDASRSS